MGGCALGKKSREQSPKSAIARMLELPESTLAGGLHIELQANREAIVEGCCGVLEYDEGVIRLAGGQMVVRISGRNLSIGGLDRNSTVVSGFITSIEFLG
jgi:sporulation protein YqfC